MRSGMEWACVEEYPVHLEAWEASRREDEKAFQAGLGAWGGCMFGLDEEENMWKSEEGAEVREAGQSGGRDRTSQMRRKENWSEDGAWGWGGRGAVAVHVHGLQGSKGGEV